MCRYVASYKCCKYTLFFWVPSVIILVSILVVFIEFRVGLQYVTTALNINWQLPDCTLGSGCEDGTSASKASGSSGGGGSADNGGGDAGATSGSTPATGSA